MATVKHINPESMHKSPEFSQGIVVPAGARTLIIGGQTILGDQVEIYGVPRGNRCPRAIVIMERPLSLAHEL